MSHENYGRHRAETADQTPVRGVDFGPFDISEISPEVLDEFRRPSTDEVVVRTRSLWLRVPLGSTINEVYDEDRGKASGLLIGIKGTSQLEPMTISLTVYAAATSDQLWASQGKSAMVESMEGDSLSPQVRSGIWGYEILSRVGVHGGQQFIVVGADGPRWMVRAVAYGKYMVQGNWEIVAEILNSCVVNRGEIPEPPGVELDVSLLPFIG